jgi:hypothetical protein
VRLSVSTTGASGTGSVIFNNTVNASGGVSITADEILFNRGAASVTGTGTISLSQGTVGRVLEVGGSSISDASHFNATTLAAFSPEHGAFTFGATNSGPVVIDSGLNLPYGLSFLSGSTITLNGSLASSATNGGGISLLGKTNLLSGTITTVNQPISLQNTTLAGHLTLTTGTTNGAVNLLGTVDGTAATATDLVIRSGSGAVTFNGLVGGAQSVLGTVNVQTTGTTSFKAGAFANAISTGSAGLGTTLISGTMRALSGDITIGNNASLLASTVFNASGSVNFGGRLSGDAKSRFTLNSQGNLTQSGAWNLLGPVALSASNITLTSTGNNFGTLLLNGANVSLREASATDLGTSSITGNLTIVSAGALTDSGALTISGSSFFTGSIITLDHTSSSFGKPITLSAATSATLINPASFSIASATAPGTLKLSTSGNLILEQANVGTLILNGSNAVVTSATTLKLGASTLSGGLQIVSEGSVSESGAVVLGASKSLTVQATGSGASITLDNSRNSFSGPISLATTGSGSATLVTNGNALLQDINIGGSFTGKATKIQQSNPLAIGGNAAFTAGNLLDLTNASNVIGGTLSLAGAGVSFSGHTGSFGAVSAASLSLDLDQDITQSATWKVGGLTRLNAYGHNILLSNSSNNLGTLALTANNATIREAGSIDLGNSTLDGTLTAIASAGIIDSGTVSVAGAASFTAGSLVVLDGTANNYTGPLSFSATGVSFLNQADIILASASTSANFTVTSRGDISGTGPLHILGTATFQTGSTGSVILSNTSSSIGTLALNTGAADITTGGSLKLGLIRVAGPLNVTASGSISQIAAASVTGSARFTSVNGANLLLNQSRNNFAGAIALTTSGDAALRNSGSTTIAGSTIGGSLSASITNALSIVDPANSIASYGAITAQQLTLASTGDVVQTGAWKITGNASLNTGIHDLTLTGSGNQFGSLQITGNNVAVAAPTLALSGSVSGNAAFSTTAAAGFISNTGALAIDGSATLIGNGGIALTHTANRFAGTISLTSSGNAAFTNAVATTLGAGNLAKHLVLRSQGSITQDGNLSVGGTTTLSSGDSITLNAAGNQIAALGAVSAANDIEIEDSSSGLNLTQAVSGRDITIGTLGNLKLSAQGLVIGRYVSLAAIGGTFQNLTSGSGVSLLATGHYEIYSQSPSGLVRGRLTGANLLTPYYSRPAFGQSGSNAFLYETP